jgi:ABC-type oligopeptide transport system ATPase subunit
LVHSSTIVHQGKAVLFLGESGTGKSTHTRLWLKSIPDAHLLNDDSPVLAMENGEAVVYGSPWSGKTHCYHQLRFPLAGVVRLSQAPYNSIRRLSVVESFSALHPSCPPALAQDDMFQDLMVDMLSDVLSVVPVFHLECLPDEDAAWTSHDAIFKAQNM